jgi:hypothetical protein
MMPSSSSDLKTVSGKTIASVTTITKVTAPQIIQSFLSVNYHSIMLKLKLFKLQLKLQLKLKLLTYHDFFWLKAVNSSKF